MFRYQGKFKSVLWNNKDIMVDNHLYYKKELHDKGIVYIKDLIDSQGHFLAIHNIKLKYNID